MGLVASAQANSLTQFKKSVATNPFDCVPLADLRDEANDLIYNGQKISSAEARALQARGVDLSLLSPSPSDFWSEQPYFSDLSQLQVHSGEEVRFVGVIESLSNYFRFHIEKTQVDGTASFYTVLVGKKAQQHLLRRELLLKLGYKIEPMKRLSQLKVRFRTFTEKEMFIEGKRKGAEGNRRLSMRSKLGDPTPWVTNIADERSSLLELRDIYILPFQPENVRLVGGGNYDHFDSDVKKNRTLNALLVAFNLVDYTESIDGIRWFSSHIENQNLCLPIEDNFTLAPTLSDLRWMGRKIARLQRQDFIEIVERADIIPCGRPLLVEKLISRRNSLLKNLGVQATPLAFNPALTILPHIVSGRLESCAQADYATRAQYPEQESPISKKEMFAFFKARGVATALGVFVNQVNQLLPFKDPADMAAQRVQKRLYEDFINFLKTGQPLQQSLGLWVKPIVGGAFIAQRDVVAGAYLGTENRIALADTIGFAIETGMTFGAAGLNPNLFAFGTSKISKIRTFTHVRPLNSIESALKTPLENIIVPLFEKKLLGDISDDILEQLEKAPTEDERAKIIQKVLDTLQTDLREGESLIMSDSFGPSTEINLIADMGTQLLFDKRLALQAGLQAKMVTMKRTHILRAGQDIHIYKDDGNIKSLAFQISLQAQIEALSVKLQTSRGQTKTEFFKLSLNPENNMSQIVGENLKAFRDFLVTGEYDFLRAVDDPDKMTHDFRETALDFKLFQWTNLKLNQSDRIYVQRAYSDHKEGFIRHFYGERRGSDYQTLAADVLNELISEALGTDIKISNPTSGDPADTLGGKSFAHYAYFESRIESVGKNRFQFNDKFVNVTYRWRGWSASKDKIQETINKFSQRYDYVFFDPQALNNVKRAQLYTLDLNVSFYEKGINHLLSLPVAEVRKIFSAHFTPRRRVSTAEEQIAALNTFFEYRSKALTRIGSGFDRLAADAITKLITVTEKSLDKEGLIKIVGGSDRIYVRSDLRGFLKGEDNAYADMPPKRSTIGLPGSQEVDGPLTQVQREMGMTESEFLAQWIMRRM